MFWVQTCTQHVEIEIGVTKLDCKPGGWDKRMGVGVGAQLVNVSPGLWTQRQTTLQCIFLLLSGEPDYFGRNKILSGYDLSHYQVPHCIRVFFYFVWFVFIHHNFQFYFKLCTYCNILDVNLS